MGKKKRKIELARLHLSLAFLSRRFPVHLLFLVSHRSICLSFTVYLTYYDQCRTNSRAPNCNYAANTEEANAGGTSVRFGGRADRTNHHTPTIDDATFYKACQDPNRTRRRTRPTCHHASCPRGGSQSCGQTRATDCRKGSCYTLVFLDSSLTRTCRETGHRPKVQGPTIYRGGSCAEGDR